MTQNQKIGERIMPDHGISRAVLQASLNQYAFAASRTVGKSVLDVACGSGLGSRYLKQKGAKAVVGVDISPEAILAAKSLCTGEGGVGFVLAEAAQLPFRGDSFEAIVSIETLEHLIDHHKFLEECKRVLKDGGILICSTPNRRISAYIGGRSANPYHINELSPEELENLLNRYFVDVELWGQDYWLRGNIIERKLVSILRATLFRIYLVRQLAYFAARLLSRQFQPTERGRDIVAREQDLDERHRPFRISGSVKPAGLLAVARCVKQKPRELSFSVIIPTKDRMDDLTQCIRSVVRQSKRPKEIIVVDGSIYQRAEDNMRSMCSQAGIAIKYIKQTEGRFARAKNLGVMQAEGDIVLFVDDDVTLEDGYLEELERIYQRDIDGLVGGVKGTWAEPVGYHPIKEAYNRLFLLGGVCRDKASVLPSGACFVPMNLTGVKKADGFVGPAHSYRRTVLDELRFDEDLEEGDELNFSIRVARKYDLYLTPQAKFVHKHVMTGRNIAANQTWNTYARYYIFKRLMKQSLKNRLCFLWSHIGWVLGYLGLFLLRPTKANYQYLKGTLRGTVMIVRRTVNRRDVL